MAEPYYTTAADLRIELGGLTVGQLSNADATLLIQQAEDRIDGLLGGWPVDETTLRKIVEADVESWQWSLLGRATVVLAALLYGTPNLLTQPRYRREKGPDFEVEDPLGGVIPDTVIGPLNGSGLRVLAGRALPGGSRTAPILRSWRDA